MTTRVLLSTGALAGAAILAGRLPVGAFSDVDVTATPDALGDGGATVVATGGSADVITATISGVANWSDAVYRAYSVGTTSCNVGNVPLSWEAQTSWHPVIAQAMYRYRIDGLGHGRFEQIGQSWLKHGFCALDQDECGTCQDTGCESLGIGCSDPYSPTRNGAQPFLGPKFEVDPSSGMFPYPPADPPHPADIDRRLRVRRSDVEAAGNPGAIYFFEAAYVHPEDNPTATSVQRAANNASYRQALLAPDGEALDYVGDTVTMRPAIFVWADLDPTIRFETVALDTHGTIHVASQAYPNGNGTWDYEYAIHNMDIGRGIRTFGVPIPHGVNVSNFGFHDVDYHSGDGLDSTNVDGTPWTLFATGGELIWQTESFAQNENANALRWGTTYNFRFTSQQPPVEGTARLEFFKPGGPPFVSAKIKVPAPPAPPCPGDVDADGLVGFIDLLVVLQSWGPCAGCAGDLDGDDLVGFDDILVVLAGWGPC